MVKTIAFQAAGMLCAVALNAQNIVAFSVTQPPQFVVDAGSDQTYSGSALVLGGVPTAIGGGADYAYAWSPVDGLNDPTAPNPLLSTLASTTTYSVTVTDLANGCQKVDEVVVTFSPTTGLADVLSAGSSIHPNPAFDIVNVQAGEVMTSITVRSLSGQQVLLAAYPVGRTAALSVGTLSHGMYLLTITTASGRIYTHKLCRTASDR